MKALTLKQPWASLVVYGGKLIENRTWDTNFRGRFLVHAGLGWDHGCYDWVARNIGRDVADTLPYPSDAPRGVLIGEATLIAVVAPGRTNDLQNMSDRKWHMPDQYGFVLMDVRPLRQHLPLRGYQKFFEVPEL